MEGALGSQPRGVGAPREDESSALQGLARFGGSCRERDRERQRHARPARSLPNKRERVAAPRKVGRPSHGGGRSVSQQVNATPNRVITWGPGRRQR
jgi:hypothetical protein